MSASAPPWTFPPSRAFGVFAAAAALSLASALALVVWPSRDFIRYGFQTVHSVAGLAALFSGAAALRSFVRRSGFRPAPPLWAAPILIALFLPFAHVPFMASWSAALAVWALLSRRGTRAVTLLFLLLFGSGLYATPFFFYAPTVRTDLFYWLHIGAAVAFVAWFQSLRRILRERGDKEAPAPGRIGLRKWAAPALGAAAVVCVVGYGANANRRFAQPPGRFAEGLPFRIDALGAAEKPREDPAPYLAASESCSRAECHPDIYRQWLASPHRLSARFPTYRKSLNDFAGQFGWEASSLCSSCHFPTASVLGVPDREGNPEADRLRGEGVSCQQCHAVTKADPLAGNGSGEGSLKLLFPSPLKGGMDGLEKVQTRFLTSDLYHHRRDFGKMNLERGAWCGSCHRSIVPESLTGGRRWVQGDTYSDWKERETEIDLSCTDCHMPLATYSSSSIHARPDHRMFGVSQNMRLLAPEGSAPEDLLKEYDEAAALWLRGELPVPKYEMWYLKYTGSGKYRAARALAGKPAAVGLELEISGEGPDGIRVTLRAHNNAVAHRFPSFPLDLREAWIETSVRDAGGALLYRTCPEDGPGGPDCHVFGGTLVDAEGRPVEKYRFWNNARVVDPRIIPPGETMTFDLVLPVPRGAKRPLKVEARCRFRLFNKSYTNWVYGPGAKEFPIMELSRAALDLP